MRVILAARIDRLAPEDKHLLQAAAVGEHAERLAHHAVRGGLKDKAVEYLNEAGNKALMRSGYREAIGFF